MIKKKYNFIHPHRRLPEGETEDSIYHYLLPFCVEDGNREEMQNYLKEHLLRMLYTYSILPRGQGNLLEIGSNPYYMSLIIKKFTRYNLYCSNYFIGENSDADRIQTVVHIETKEAIEFRFKHFNIETYDFPYPDDLFDVVLFCEVIEHLASDPLKAVLEIKRILKPGGYLVLTTPNVCRIENIIKLIVGGNIYDPYSRHGIYGRHNREYTRNELFLLLKHAGFEFEDGFTSNVDRNKTFDQTYLKQVMKLIKTMKNREYDLGHCIFIRAKNTREVEGEKPGWLYDAYSSF
jgi:SAM-dependent methyltransferase